MAARKRPGKRDLEKNPLGLLPKPKGEKKGFFHNLWDASDRKQEVERVEKNNAKIRKNSRRTKAMAELGHLGVKDGPNVRKGDKLSEAMKRRPR